MYNQYIYIFIGVFVLSVFLTKFMISFATRFGIMDQPGALRKIHQYPIPLMGGVAVFLAFFASLFVMRGELLSGNLEISHWIGFFVGALFLMIGGFMDDKYRLSATKQIIWPILAVISVIVGGVEIEKLSNPFGGYLYPGALSAIIIFIWLMCMMYTTKLLDGVDGLVSGVGFVGSLVIFLFTITTRYYQPDIAMAALVFAGALFGFLIWNWHPAKIFLGEGGGLLVGYVLGVLSIISGAKIAIALLIIGFPAMDVAWTILRRIIAGKNPFAFSDRQHLHHRLLDLGFGQRSTVIFYYILSAFFGVVGLFLQSIGKLTALASMLAFMLALVIWLRKK